MRTLAELATYICEKLRSSDDTSLDRCKGFIRTRHEQLYNKHLWRDSIVMVTKAVAPSSNTLEAAGTVLLPPVVGLVLAVRTGDRALEPNHEEIFYRVDVDDYDQTGTILGYADRAPVCWEFAEATEVEIIATNSSDNGARVFVRFIDENDENHAAEFTVTAVAGKQVSVGTANLKVIEEVGKATTSSDIRFRKASDESTLFDVRAASTEYRRRARIRLFEKPSEADTIRVLAKARHIPMESDFSRPQIEAIEACLIAHAEADLLWFLRQVGKAQAKVAEAVALEMETVGREVIQRNNNPRLIPAVSEPHDWNGSGLYSKDFS